MGTATGPFPGTFSESGTVTPTAPGIGTLDASFTVMDSTGAVIVSGHKTATGTATGSDCKFSPEFIGTGMYTTTIPADSGTTMVDLGIASPPTFNGAFSETFVSALTNLGNLIAGFGLPAGTANSLLAKVNAAQASLAAGNTTAACNELGALINEASAQSGKKLPSAEAAAIIAAAEAIRTALGCP
jgi:hypothetical protein